MYHTIVYKEAIKKIESKDKNIVIEGIKALRESGKPDAVINIAELLNYHKAVEVQNECIRFLNDIKDQKAVGFLVDMIKKKKNNSVLQHMVSSAWQNNLDYSEHLELFAEIALNEDYIIAYEAFTVIENNIDRADGELADKVQDIISTGLKNAEKEKQPMLDELLHVIKDLKKQ